MAQDKTILFETTSCTGCKTCEIACSYHHRGIFRPSISSIEVKTVSKEGEVIILFYKQANGSHLACDGCQGEKEPLCTKYCNVLARDELKAFLRELVK